VGEERRPTVRALREGEKLHLRKQRAQKKHVKKGGARGGSLKKKKYEKKKKRLLKKKDQGGLRLFWTNQSCSRRKLSRQNRTGQLRHGEHQNKKKKSDSLKIEQSKVTRADQKGERTYR